MSRRVRDKDDNLRFPGPRCGVSPDLRDLLPRAPDRIMRDLAIANGGVDLAILVDAGVPVTRGDTGIALTHELIVIELLDGADVAAELLSTRQHQRDSVLPGDEVCNEEWLFVDQPDLVADDDDNDTSDEPESLRPMSIEAFTQELLRDPDLRESRGLPTRKLTKRDLSYNHKFQRLVLCMLTSGELMPG